MDGIDFQQPIFAIIETGSPGRYHRLRAYVPRYRLPATQVAAVWGGNEEGLPIREKAVAGFDEDVITMSIEAARNALHRAGISPLELRAVWVGSESHPYAVKPSSTIVAEAIGASANIQAGDWEFACKAGTEALVAATAMVGAGMARYTLAIGMDTAQGKPGDALEYTAGSGGAAYILGPADEALAVLESSYSFVTDTPDFWRRKDKSIRNTASASRVNRLTSNISPQPPKP
jgi:hydroxymethylglutaryl-CoA synthase